ncbi:MAG: hypothetical protein SVU69_06705 [Pseudomonadota bacterium]|nr:hypothetical protein [Pseudomonadota bacterium]
MSIRELIKQWEASAKSDLTAHEYCVRLSIHDAARVAALAEMYAQRSESEIITDLIGAALDELESSLPYQEGQRVVATDEQGDPIYEDAGPSRRLYELTQKFAAQLEADSRGAK